MTNRAAYYQARVMRHRLDDGSFEFAVHDVFFGDDDGVLTYTIEARSPRKRSVAELKAWIISVITSGEPEVVCGDLGYAHSIEDHLMDWLELIDEPPIEYRGHGGEVDSGESSHH